MIDDFVSDHCMEIPSTFNEKYKKTICSFLDAGPPFIKLLFCTLPDCKGFRKVMGKKFENFYVARVQKEPLQSNCTESKTS